MDGRDIGGLSLTTGQVGFAYGTVGVISLLLGGILGGIAIARNGLKHWLWPMAVALSLPNLVYLYLAYALPENLFVINACVGIEQFGYGFGMGTGSVGLSEFFCLGDDLLYTCFSGITISPV